MTTEHFRSVAEAADNGGRPWEWSGGYPQWIIRQGDAVLIAETYEGPDFPSTIAEFIATFDPPTVLGLLDRLAKVRALCDQWDAMSKGETSTTRQIRDVLDG